MNELTREELAQIRDILQDRIDQLKVEMKEVKGKVSQLPWKDEDQLVVVQKGLFGTYGREMLRVTRLRSRLDQLLGE